MCPYHDDLLLLTYYYDNMFWWFPSSSGAETEHMGSPHTKNTLTVESIGIGPGGRSAGAVAKWCSVTSQVVEGGQAVGA